MFGVLINVASNSSCVNGRGRIFGDGTFEYLPIQESRETIEKVPTYSDLGFSNVKYPHLRVHVDPEFQTYTYGHVKRGFGDIQSIARLKKDDVLFFYATLQQNSSWAPYIIGYFLIWEVLDCRNFSIERIRSLGRSGFENNAHLKRADPHVDFLIKGTEGSRLLSRAFALSEKTNPLTLKESLRDVVLTAKQRRIDLGKPWFRWTMVCPEAEPLLIEISAMF